MKPCNHKILLSLFLLTALFSNLSLATNWKKSNKIPDGYAIQVEVIKNNDGTLTAFYIEADREVIYRTQLMPNSDQWSDRKSLEIYANQIKLAKHQDGRIEVFAIGTLASVVSHVTQQSPHSDNWSKEQTVKGVYATQIELATNQDGSLMLFFIKPDKEVAYIRQTTVNSNEWSQKKDLDSYANQIAVANHNDGRLELAIIGTLASVTSHQTQLAANSDEWSKEKDLKGVYALQVEFGRASDGSLYLFYIKPDKEIAYLTAPSSSQAAWSKSQALDTYGNLIEVGNNSTGQLVVVIVGTFGNVLTYITQNETASGLWSKEMDMKAYATQMRLINNAEGHLALLHIAPVSGQLHHSQADD